MRHLQIFIMLSLFLLSGCEPGVGGSTKISQHMQNYTGAALIQETEILENKVLVSFYWQPDTENMPGETVEKLPLSKIYDLPETTTLEVGDSIPLKAQFFYRQKGVTTPQLTDIKWFYMTTN